MQVTIRYFDGCPNWRLAEARVRAALVRLGRADVPVTRELVDTAERARMVGFRGSPTIVVDGRDVFPEPQAPVGLSCRLYVTNQELAGAPSEDQLVEVLGG